MNGNPALSGELLHLILAFASALCGAVFTLCGGLTLFFVKRAVSQRDDEIKQLKAAVATLQTEHAEFRGRLGALKA